MIVTRAGWEVEKLRDAGRINGEAQRLVPDWLVPGTSPRQVDQRLARFLSAAGAQSSFHQLFGFPGCCCISVNDGVGHGVPSEYPLEDGDVVKVDIGVSYEGYHSDAAATYIVGAGTIEAQKLVEVTRRALAAGVEAATVGRKLSDVSHSIEETVRGTRYSIFRQAFGHGIGTDLHEEPQIAAFGPPGYGPRIRPGMVFAIEPVVVAGIPSVRTAEDGWTTKTRDGSLAAHFEHTVLATPVGPEVLTAVPGEAGKDAPFTLPGSCCLNGTKLTIRVKCEKDDEAVFALAKAEMDPILREAWGRPVQPDEVLTPAQACTYVVTADGGRLIAFCILSRREDAIHVNSLVVARESQGGGLGRLLMAGIEQLASAEGMARIDLWVQRNNPRARRFYLDLGFSECGFPYFETIAMSKSLTGLGPPTSPDPDRV